MAETKTKQINVKGIPMDVWRSMHIKAVEMETTTKDVLIKSIKVFCSPKSAQIDRRSLQDGKEISTILDKEDYKKLHILAKRAGFATAGEYLPTIVAHYINYAQIALEEEIQDHHKDPYVHNNLREKQGKTHNFSTGGPLVSSLPDFDF